MSKPNYYNVLGVSQDATQEEIKKAYRKLSLQYHPDRNPSQEANNKMNEINGAYDVLGDSESRKRYDMESRINTNINGSDEFNDLNNIFNMMFNNMQGMNGAGMPGMPNIHVFSQNGPGKFHIRTQFNSIRKPQNINKRVIISLAQAFTGHVMEIDITRQVVKDNITTNEQETIYTNIPAGIDNDETIVIPNKGNIIDNMVSNINITVHIENNTTYIRQGLDLIMKKNISLKESLCGFISNFEYLNGKTYTLNNKENFAIIKPGLKRVIPKMGMVRENNVGNLIIHFEVEFPVNLNEDIRKKLEEILE